MKLRLPPLRAGEAGALALVSLACAAPSGPAPSTDAGTFRVIAHRGASAHAPENTLPAFLRAQALGAREVELDVQLSRDGVVVLFHDGTLDEKTDLSGPVRDHDAATLLRTDVGRWFESTHPDAGDWTGTTLIRLEDLFVRMGASFHYHVEMKSREPRLPDAVLAVARRHRLESRITLTSFHLELLLSAREKTPGLPLAWLVKISPAIADARQQAEVRRTLVERADREGFSMIAFPARELDAALVTHAHERGLGIRAWKVEDEALLLHALRAGADGATVDWPGRALEIVRKHSDAGS